MHKLSETIGEQLKGMLPDGGPVYRETNLESIIVEPYNTVTATFFLFIAAYWLIRLKGNYSNYILIAVSMVFLSIGGFGGALYHGLRSSFLFLLLDIAPIFGLGLAASVYLWSRLIKKTWKIVAIIALFVLTHIVIGYIPWSNHTLSDSVGYANVGLMIFIPLIGVLMKTKFRYAWLVLAATVFFATAINFRIMDFDDPPFSMGTHWLWHTFGAAAAFMITHYFYRLITLRNRALRMRVDF